MNKFILTLLFVTTSLLFTNLVSAQSIADLKVLNQAKTTTEVKDAKVKAQAALDALDKKIADLDARQKGLASSSADYQKLEKAKYDLQIQKEAYKKIAARMTPGEEILRMEKSLQAPDINPRNAEALRTRIAFLKKIDI